MIYIKNSFSIIKNTLELKPITITNLLRFTENESDLWKRADMVPREHSLYVRKAVTACKHLNNSNIICEDKMGYILVDGHRNLLQLIQLGMNEIEAADMLIDTIKEENYKLYNSVQSRKGVHNGSKKFT